MYPNDNIIVLLLSLTYIGNIGTCIRNGYLFNVPTVLVNPTQDMYKELKIKRKKLENKERVYSNNKVINFIILTILEILIYIFDLNREKLKAKIPNPFLDNGNFTNKFVKDCIRFSKQGDNIDLNFTHIKDHINKILEYYVQNGYKLIFIENYNDINGLESIELTKYKFFDDNKYIIIFGCELLGIPKDLIKRWSANGVQLYITTKLEKSLNVSIINGIVLHYIKN
jgi:tRNA G18 (ribose-2'-O)-methylase SpoU